MADDQVTSAAESIVGALPLGSSPLGRIALGVAAGTAVAYFVRPNVSFYSNGRPREWIFTDSANPEATIFPYWAYPLIPAIVLGVLL